VVLVPELFEKEEDWTIYYDLVKELTEMQKDQVKGASLFPGMKEHI
jgi:hypothetical protein